MSETTVSEKQTLMIALIELKRDEGVSEYAIALELEAMNRADMIEWKLMQFGLEYMLTTKPECYT